MQFLVPQNIDLEDKVIGPLTLRQFIYLLIGGMIDYGLFQVFDTSLFVLIAMPISIFWIAMAFIKVQEQSFGTFLMNFFLYTRKPKVRRWSSRYHSPGLSTEPGKQTAKPEVKPKEISDSELDKLAHIVGTRGWDRDSAEAKGRVTSHSEARAKIGAAGEPGAAREPNIPDTPEKPKSPQDLIKAANQPENPRK